jgi:fructose-1,6-bisphosphatase-3
MYKEKYFEELKKEFNNEDEIVTEIVNLEAILNLPKGTEYFISDIHGEYDGLNHILKTGAGIISEKINLRFPDMAVEDKKELNFVVAYPKFALEKIQLQKSTSELTQWYSMMITRLIEVTQHCASKYSRSKVRKCLPKKYAYIIEELLYVEGSPKNKQQYYQQIISKVIELHRAEDLIQSLAATIQKLVIDHIHIVGDVFDRGSKSNQVLELLENAHSLDFQWGNHDVLWLGAFAGSKACVATLFRIATRYGYIFDLEREYGINLRPLFTFADQNYQADPFFYPKSGNFDQRDRDLLSKVHQALIVMQFKLESQIIERQTDFEMHDRLFLNQVHRGSIELQHQTYSLEHACFQTVNPEQPYELTGEERQVMHSLSYSFHNSPKIEVHMNFILTKGSMYLIYNNNLLYHGCIPLTEDGDFDGFEYRDHRYEGKDLLNFFEEHIRAGMASEENTENDDTDLMWYCWIGKKSPLFGRRAMTTFERYFISDPATHQEGDNPYFKLRDRLSTAYYILRKFGLDEHSSYIINGHTPVKASEGESPIKGGGQIIVIDGGLSKAYQKATGIAGYTLINNSFGFQIVTHFPFCGVEDLYQSQSQSAILKRIIDRDLPRRQIADTTIGTELKRQIDDLKYLLESDEKGYTN